MLFCLLHMKNQSVPEDVEIDGFTSSKQFDSISGKLSLAIAPWNLYFSWKHLFTKYFFPIYQSAG